jgi:hypothetical protein
LEAVGGGEGRRHRGVIKVELIICSLSFENVKALNCCLLPLSSGSCVLLYSHEMPSPYRIQRS